MDSTGLNVYLDKDQDHLEYFKMSDQSWTCENELPCDPLQFKENMINKIKKEGGEEMNIKLTLFR